MKLSYNLLEEYINENDNVIIGVSGGADSMCLLHLLVSLKNHLNFNLTAVHVNHGIRETEADRDQKFVEASARKLGINLIVKKVDAINYAKENCFTIEEAARNLRYKCFNEIVKNGKIFVAHNASDQAETVLMHIARGASINGASGIKKVNGNIYRPLLHVEREDILKYLASNQIDYILDSSNLDNKYHRNYIRNNVLVALKQVYPKVVRSICSFAESCSEDANFINSLLPKEYLLMQDGGVLLKTNFCHLHKALSFRLIKRAFEMLGIYADIEKKHMQSVLELSFQRSGSILHLPHNVCAYKVYDGVFIEIDEQTKKTQSEQKFALKTLNFEPFGKISAKTVPVDSVDFKDGNHYVDYNFVQGAVWRFKKNGDIFKKYKSGTKSLADYFTDQKVQRRLRDFVPVLAIENEILVVANMNISDKVKVTGNTKKVVKICYQPSNLLTR